MLAEVMGNGGRGDGEAVIRKNVDTGRDVDDDRRRVLLGCEVEPELERLVARIGAIDCDQDLLHGVLLFVLVLQSSACRSPAASGRPPIRSAENYGFGLALAGIA
jgi:hypothetical protein